MYRRYLVLCTALLAMMMADCAKHQPAAVGTPSPAITASAVQAAVSPVASEALGSPLASEAPASPSAAAPSPTSAGPVDVLSFNEGMLIRSAPQSAAYLSPYGLTDTSNTYSAWTSPKGSSGPFVWVFELAASATLTSFEAVTVGATSDAQTIHVATSASSAESDYSDVGTYNLIAGQKNTFELEHPLTARWIKLTVDSRAGSDVTTLTHFAAYGTLAQPSVPAKPLAGSWLLDENPGTSSDPMYNTSGVFSEGLAEKLAASPPIGSRVKLLHIVQNGESVHAVECNTRYVEGVWGGMQTGYQLIASPIMESKFNPRANGMLNTEGSLLVGSGWGTFIAKRLQGNHPCPSLAFTQGQGKTVLVLGTKGDDTGINTIYYPAAYPGYRFALSPAAMLTAQQLAGIDSVVLRNVCDATAELANWQADALMAYVSAGHKLIIADADQCTKSDYSFLPYPFTTSNPGARGAHGSNLVIVESNTLGSSDKSDSVHFVDIAAYRTWSIQQIGDANTVTSQSPQWCGHLFGTNILNINGYMQMYAPYGKGLIIFDGLDWDDANFPVVQQIWRLELAAEIPPDLPCTQKVSQSFIIEPSQEIKFVPGKAQALIESMQLMANQGWKGHVALSTTGDFRASVIPAAVDLAGGSQTLKILVTVPASAKPGAYALIVTGDGGEGHTAQATLNFSAAVPIVKELQVQRRIRLYGIHFDVDKATIKPQSEATIAQIAQIMQQNPTWRFRVEGHTDSDGGYQHNMVLSQQRAQSVVNDLVSRYHIARARLVAVGYGYSHPVASNATAAGKALNRRVELVRL